MIKKEKDWLISTVYTRVLARVMGMQERNLSSLLRGTSLSNSVLINPEENFITIEQQMRVLENARSISGNDDIGLHFASQLHPSIHGPLGFLVTSSPDLHSAIKAFSEYLPIRIPFGRIEIEYEENWLLCICEFNIELDYYVQRMLQECFAFIIQAIVGAVLGRAFTEGVIQLKHNKPDYYPSYRKHIYSPVYFSQTANVFKIPKKLIYTHNVSGNPEFHIHSQRQCQQLLNRLPKNTTSTVDQVQHILLSSPIGSLTEAQVAQRLFISKRTLSRRLKVENTTYREVTEEILSKLAVNHLQDSNLSIDSIAHILGYNDSAAFRKAFRRWHVISPSEYRNKLTQ
ncbi:AraC family transcriptional regulator [Paraglaciecola arctica]|uniref:AraC family transcriptional regulator n=1 Tax=Paraglaciecola arctica TaxID=1128911 RepID=UPI001C0701DA|nr:AraC family transcriptional regulator [Paraglaciecola arctica]MBU3002493.1 AraC family transcriptional regulator [Paraglaciecola arctica]